MSRYTGPKVKVLRRLGQQLPGLTRKTMQKRPHPPGQHGQSRARRRKASDYRIRLQEKQKLRFNYGVGEKQFRGYIKKVSASKRNSGELLLEILESRLDNVVFRAGYAPTIPAARQLVNHGHIQINGKKVDIASYQTRPGDCITLRERSQKVEVILTSLASPSLARPGYLDYDAEKMSATFTAIPERKDIPLDIQENLIIEFYSQMV